MNPLTKYVLAPLAAPLAIVGLYYTPVALIGCANRGLLAFGVAIVSLLTGISIGVGGLAARARREPVSPWWIASVAILAMPAMLLLGPLG